MPPINYKYSEAKKLYEDFLRLYRKSYFDKLDVHPTELYKNDTEIKGNKKEKHAQLIEEFIQWLIGVSKKAGFIPLLGSLEDTLTEANFSSFKELKKSDLRNFNQYFSVSKQGARLVALLESLQRHTNKPVYAEVHKFYEATYKLFKILLDLYNGPDED